MTLPYRKGAPNELSIYNKCRRASRKITYHQQNWAVTKTTLGPGGVRGWTGDAWDVGAAAGTGQGSGQGGRARLGDWEP